MKSEIKILPATATVTISELNKLRRKANRLWGAFKRAEKRTNENPTTANMRADEVALDDWHSAQREFQEALTGRKYAKPEPIPPTYLTHDPGDPQLRENV